MKNLGRLLLWSVGCIGTVILGARILSRGQPDRPMTRDETTELIDRLIEWEEGSRKLGRFELASLDCDMNDFMNPWVTKYADPQVLDVANAMADMYLKDPASKDAYGPFGRLDRLRELREMLRRNSDES